MPTSEHEPAVVGALDSMLVGDEVVLRAGRPRPATVAVCIPVRNGEATLERCLDSVLGQEGVDLRVVVVDNDSTDRTFAIAAGRAARDPRVVVYRNPRDLGRIGNWNRCLELVDGCTYAKLLMASDELLPGFLARTVAAMDAHPGAVLLRASLSFRHPDGRVEFLPHFDDDRALAGAEARRLSLTEGNLAANPSGQLWRTAALDGLRFDESLPWASDYDFALSLLERGDYLYLREQLYVFDLGVGRFHTGTAPAVRFLDECVVALRHGGPEALPLLERTAAELGGGPELEAILAETRSRLQTAPTLETRGVSFLLELGDGWREALHDYVEAFRPEDDVTLVLKPLPGSDLDTVVAAVSAEIGDGETADVLLEPSPAPAAALAPQVSRVVGSGTRFGPLFRALRPRVPQSADPCVHVVMPIGVGAPGTPVPRLLRASLESLARQTYRDFRVTVAADENIAPEARALVESFGAEIAWWPTNTYFAKGGIWKKITDGWQAVPSDYVAYMHYDDLWAETKLAEQLAFVEANGLDGCWTSGLSIDDDGVLVTDDIALERLDEIPAGAHPGAWTVHSTLVSRRAILDSGILDHEERWAAIFEQLFFLYLRKIGNVAKCRSTQFYYRDHPQTLTNTGVEDAEFVVSAREETSYTLDETLADAAAIDLDQLAERLVAGML